MEKVRKLDDLEADDLKIAAFMGFRYKGAEDVFLQYHYELHNYSEDWNMLMQAVKTALNKDFDYPNVYQLHLSDALRTAEIKEVYKSLINFIDSTNPTTPPPPSPAGAGEPG